jgi:hypothetical protein
MVHDGFTRCTNTTLNIVYHRHGTRLSCVSVLNVFTTLHATVSGRGRLCLVAKQAILGGLRIESRALF